MSCRISGLFLLKATNFVPFVKHKIFWYGNKSLEVCLYKVALGMRIRCINRTNFLQNPNKFGMKLRKGLELCILVLEKLI